MKSDVERDKRLRGIGMTSQRTRDRLVARLRDQGIRSERVLAQMAQVPRHVFVDEAMAHRAYEDTSLPLAHGQTISQPFVVALMTQYAVQNQPRRVLEVGTGCGYQTAVLAGLCNQVYSIERIPQLAARAKNNLSLIGVRNVVSQVGDGYLGWPVHAPFDAIVVTAAPPALPEALTKQLAPDGVLVIPVGSGADQELRVIRNRAGGLVEEVVEQVTFVPLQQGVAR